MNFRWCIRNFGWRVGAACPSKIFCADAEVRIERSWKLALVVGLKMLVLGSRAPPPAARQSYLRIFIFLYGKPACFVKTEVDNSCAVVVLTVRERLQRQHPRHGAYQMPWPAGDQRKPGGKCRCGVGQGCYSGKRDPEGHAQNLTV